MLRVAFLWFVPAVAVLCLSGCASERADLSETTILSPVASHGAPISSSNHVAVLSEEIACVINSYESQIHCVDRINGNVTVFGSEGRGPGEFASLSGIGRSRDGHVVAMDIGEDRLTFFSPNGMLVSETRLPQSFSPSLLRGDRLYGFEFVMPDFEKEFEPSYVPMEVDILSGEVLWKRTGLADVVDRDCFNPAIGASTPGGGLVFQVCDYELAFVAHKDDSTATVVASPSYVEALPNERDLAAFMDFIIPVRTLAGPIPESEMDAIAAGFLETPKEWLLKPAPFGFDNRDRLWIATTRDRDAFSYFDIWIDTTYVGTVRVDDRLMGFDIFDSTLVTLVERAPDDDGIAERAIDWYDLGEIDWSH
ncbi:MAG: hypothetical protein F4058_00050 [Rhodothermaceae bacterium]|nr:hypothetical protein [Rhodothermaceae bacterium]MYI83705.1 hypothetical protein [Rhodothermaceae bacterium]